MQTTDRPLFPHQREAVDAVRKVLADSSRATAVMACGTGKTRVGSEVAHLLARTGTGRALVVVPTLDLIAQTMREWRDHLGAAALGRVVAVCSDREILSARRTDLASSGTHVTVDPAQLAELAAGSGSLTIACTYQSLGVLAEAHARHGLADVDIAIIDEAHRTAGAAGKAWAAVHDDTIVRSRRRLYLTATPRVVTSDHQDVVSMSDEGVYGPVAHRLAFSTAIQLGLLASYRTVIPVVTSEQVHSLLGKKSAFLKLGNAAVAANALATQIAVLRAAQEHRIRRMITFHRRVADARWFARMLPHAYKLLDPAERPAGLWSGYVHGTQDSAERRAVLDRLGGDDERLIVVSNARVLSEGIDVPAVDAVCFLDPRGTIDTIQAVGRALRRKDRTKPKTASIVVPVLLGPDQEPESALSSSAFGPVWQTVRALAAHDEDLAQQLDRARRDLADPSAGPGLGRAPGELPDWLAITGIPVPPGFADAVAVRTVRMVTTAWEEYIAAAAAYRAHNSDLQVPAGHRTHTGLPLGTWIGHLRQAYSKGTLSAHRIKQMDELGMIWSVTALELQKLIKELRLFKNKHGNLLIPRPHIVETPGEDPYRLGEITHNLRVSQSRGEVHPDKVAALNAEGFIWEIAAHIWEQFWSDLVNYKRKYGHLDVPQAATSDDGQRRLGGQVASYRNHPDRLTDKQRARLDEIGFIWNALEYRYQLHIDALKAFRAEHGHARVPSKHIVHGLITLRLGSWLGSRRDDYRMNKLSEARLTQLMALGVDFGESRKQQ